MNKKLLTLALTAILTLLFTACASTGNDTGSGNDSAEQSPDAQSPIASTQPSSPAESSSQAEKAIITLEDWVQSDDGQQAQKEANSVVRATGMTFRISADGDIIVYEYTIPDSDLFSSLSTNDLADAFDPVIEANKEELTNLFQYFDSTYDIKLSGAHVTFLTTDGTELYSGDITNK